MAEILNLRNTRKQAKRRQESERANATRVAHGQPKSIRKLAGTLGEKAERHLDGHRIELGDGQ